MNAKRTRVRRGVPGKAPVVELQARDYEVLECLGRLGHLPSDLLAAHFWGSATSDPAIRRLRRLLDARLVAVTLVGSRSCNMFSLTGRGLDALVGQVGELEGVAVAEPIRAAASLRHRTLVNAMRLYLAALADAGHGTLLVWSGGRCAVAGDLGLAGQRIVPDGVAELQMQRTRGFAVCEADTGSEGVELKGKFAKYAAYFATSARVGVQLWVAASGGDKRIETVAHWAREAGIGQRTRLFREGELYVRPALAPVARLDRSGPVGP